MFDKQYTFRGKHANEVISLTSEYHDKFKLFQTVYDVYVLAPIVGFLYNRKADLDKSEGEINIFLEKLIKGNSDLSFNYRLIMLLDDEYEHNADLRIEKAFNDSNAENKQSGEELYDQYVRGGVDVIYEKILEGEGTHEKYLERIYNFMKEVYERYNEKITFDSIVELCRNNS